MIEIRPARYDDILAVEACLVKARAEMDYDIPEHEMPYSLHNLLSQAQAGLLLVAEDSGYICGVVALSLHHWPWNRQKQFLVNDHFAVLPEYRKGGTAKRLLDAAKAKARDCGVPLRIDLSGGGDREAKDRWVATQGFKFLGSQFWWEPSVEP